MTDRTLQQLIDLQDSKYRDFSIRLIPNVEPKRIIGVRVPQLRALAKQMIADGRAADFLVRLPHNYHEENMLHAMIVAQQKTGIDAAIAQVERFLPHIDNWAVGDCFGPKIFARHHEKVSACTLRWMRSDHAFTVRFGIVTQLQFFLDQHFDPQMLTIIGSIDNHDYYVDMAKAWYFSFALIKQYEATLPLFEQKRLDRTVHNLSIRKAIESFRISDERKEHLRTLRIK